MALTVGTPWGRVQRPWGYEVRVDFVAEDGSIYNEVLTFEQEPTSVTLDERISTARVGLEERIQREAAEATRRASTDIEVG
jgi:hypothetical protein